MIPYKSIDIKHKAIIRKFYKNNLNPSSKLVIPKWITTLQ